MMDEGTGWCGSLTDQMGQECAVLQKGMFDIFNASRRSIATHRCGKGFSLNIMKTAFFNPFSRLTGGYSLRFYLLKRGFSAIGNGIFIFYCFDVPDLQILD